MEYLLTYQDALEIVNEHKGFKFYKSEFRIDDYRIVTFNYRFCEYQDFLTPLKNNTIVNAYDMRGTTFVFNKDGSLYRRFFMLKKFFNVNQVEETQLQILRTKKVDLVTFKEDGSLIAFMKLPNGKIFAKTQAGFTNEQSIYSMELLNADAKLLKFVNHSLDVGTTPLFEYTSFDNRIVLKYSTRNLQLIGLRNNDNGKYYSSARMKALESEWGIKPIRSLDFKDIDEIEHFIKETENIEGVVVEFTDGSIVKWKTLWYFNLHNIRTDNVFREDFIIQNYIKMELDNITQELNYVDDKDAFDFIDKVKKSVNNWSKFIDDTVDNLINIYNNTCDEDFVLFATNYNKKPFFGLAIKKIRDVEQYHSSKIGYMLKQSYKLSEARYIVERWKN